MATKQRPAKRKQALRFAIFSRRIRIFEVFLLAFAATLIGNLAVENIGWLSRLEFGIHQSALLNYRLPRSSRISLIAVNSTTLRTLAGGRERLPRHYQAEMINALQATNVRAIVMDFLFDEPTTNADDSALSNAIRNSKKPIILAVGADVQEDEVEPLGGRHVFRDSVVVSAKHMPNRAFIGQTEAFRVNEKYSVAAMYVRDIQSGQPIKSVALCAVLAAHGHRPTEAHWDQMGGQIHNPGPLASWAVGSDSELAIRWTTPKNRFVPMEFSEALKEAKTQAGRAAFDDQIVVIGGETELEIRDTPIGQMYGMEVIAHTINTLLNPVSQITRWHLLSNVLWSGFLSIVAGLAVRTLRPVLMISGICSTLFIAVFFPQFFLNMMGSWVDTVAPCMAICGTIVLTGLLQGVRAGASARRLTPAHVRDERNAEVDEVATVMFVDLRGSTAMAESLGARKSRQILSSLLSVLAATVDRHNGDVEGMMGDGLIAVFREKKSADHALRCLAAVREFPLALEPLFIQVKNDGGPELGLTIGIESGLVSGSVIERPTADVWSSFGPTVNLAARLQGSCGQLGRSILLGSGARAVIRSDVALEFITMLSVKGFAQPVEVFGLVSESKVVSSREVI